MPVAGRNAGRGILDNVRRHQPAPWYRILRHRAGALGARVAIRSFEEQV